MALATLPASEYRSFTDTRETPGQLSLLRALALVDPAETFSILHSARTRELDLFESEDLRRIAADVRKRMELAPELAKHGDLEQLARDFAYYRQLRHFHTTFLAACGLAATHTPAVRSVVDIRGDDYIKACLAERRGGLLLLLHYGPYVAVGPLMGTMRLPMTILINDENLAEIRKLFDSVAPSGLDVEFVVPGQTAVLTCLRALRAGRFVVILPEFAYGGVQRQPDVVIPFMGTSIRAPEGAPLLAQLGNVPMIPCTFRVTGPARYCFELHEPITVGGRTKEHRREALVRLFNLVESVLTNHGPAEWLCWEFFDEMVHKDQPRRMSGGLPNVLLK